MSVKVTMNLKIPIHSYRQLCPQSSVGTVKGNPTVSATAPSQVLYKCGSGTARYRSKPTARHKMKIIQSFLLVAAIALLLLIGKYDATHTGLGGAV